MTKNRKTKQSRQMHDPPAHSFPATMTTLDLLSGEKRSDGNQTLPTWCIQLTRAKAWSTVGTSAGTLPWPGGSGGLPGRRNIIAET